MDGSTIALAYGVDRVTGLLDSPEITGLITDLERTRWTGR